MGYRVADERGAPHLDRREIDRHAHVVAATDPRGIALGGNAFPFALQWTASVSPAFMLAEFDRSSIILQGDVTYVSRQYFDPFNDRQAAGLLRKGQRGYAPANASLRYDAGRLAPPSGRGPVRQNYNAYGLNIESFGFDFFTPGAPRTYSTAV